MVTVIAIDLSASMLRICKTQDTNETFTILQLATQAVNVLMDYLATHSKLEFVAVVTFSSTCDVLCSFTRDYNLVKEKVAELDFVSNTCYPSAIQTINNLVCSEWSSTETCRVIMITDGNCYEGLRKPDITPFTFPGKLIVLSLEITSFYKNNYESNELPNSLGYIIPLNMPLTSSSIAKMIEKIAKKTYAPFSAVLKCGNLKSDIHLFPPPVSFTKVLDFEIITCIVLSPLNIIGFLESSKVGCPGIRSRHLILPQQNSDECTENNKTSSKIPNFCVLLNKALKAENMTAICELNSNWHGLVVCSPSSEKKSNLMLLTLEPGKNAIPWLGDIKNLTISPTEIDKPQLDDLRPIKNSYNQQTIVSIKQDVLQTEINKMLRHARQIPDKMSSFYKKLNQIRLTVIAYSFNDILITIADLLDAEYANLPPGTHTECGLQIVYAAMELRKPYAMDPNYEITPLIIKNALD